MYHWTLRVERLLERGRLLLKEGAKSNHVLEKLSALVNGSQNTFDFFGCHAAVLNSTYCNGKCTTCYSYADWIIDFMLVRVLSTQICFPVLWLVLWKLPPGFRLSVCCIYFVTSRRSLMCNLIYWNVPTPSLTLQLYGDSISHEQINGDNIIAFVVRAWCRSRVNLEQEVVLIYTNHNKFGGYFQK